MSIARFGIILLALYLIGCSSESSHHRDIQDEAYVLSLPTGFSQFDIPEDNPITKKKVELGEKLFKDVRLSRNENISCHSCHLETHAYSDTIARSLGTYGTSGVRNAPSIVNVAYKKKLFMEGGISDLERQIFAPFDHELEFDLMLDVVEQRLKNDPEYVRLFAEVFDTLPSIYGITRALAAFERTLVMANSPFDRYYYHDDQEALSESAKRGWAIFQSSKLNCIACHTLPLFTNHSFENVGLYEFYKDKGLRTATMKEGDIGKFPVPTLRNVEVTYPYMHDGSMETLDEVIEFYTTGGKGHPNQSPLIHPFTLTPEEREDLKAFLLSLTDDSFKKS